MTRLPLALSLALATTAATASDYWDGKWPTPPHFPEPPAATEPEPVAPAPPPKPQARHSEGPPVHKKGYVLPPVEYDHPFVGEMTVVITTLARVAQMCPKTTTSGWPTMACATPFPTTKPLPSCRIIIATKDELAKQGWDMAVVYRHESGTVTDGRERTSAQG